MMGTSALNWLNSLMAPLLGIAATAAAIAIVAAIVRHFAYEHGKNDTTTVSTRVMHVFGFLAVIGLFAGSGTAIAKGFQSIATSDVTTGKSILPEGLKQKKVSGNVGEAVKKATEKAKQEAEKAKQEDGEKATKAATTKNEDTYESAAKEALQSGDYAKAKTNLANVAIVAQKAKKSGNTDLYNRAAQFFKKMTGKSYETQADGSETVDISDEDLKYHSDFAMALEE